MHDRKMNKLGFLAINKFLISETQMVLKHTHFQENNDDTTTIQVVVFLFLNFSIKLFLQECKISVFNC